MIVLILAAPRLRTSLYAVDQTVANTRVPAKIEEGSVEEGGHIDLSNFDGN